MRRGRFITFEGGEACGKSTQAGLLIGYLQEQGIAALATREPGGTPGAEAIRELLLHPPQEEGWSPRAEAMLFAAARADHCQRVIAPALARGDWVVSDRFVDSSIAYQTGSDGVTRDDVMALHAFGSHGLMPDVTILLMVDAMETQSRMQGRGGGPGDSIEERAADYHASVARRFRELAEAQPDRFAVIEGGQSEDGVHAAVLAALRVHLPELR